MNIKISESIEMRLESHHLLISNQQKCKDILSKPTRDRNDIIDFLISLHLVLEIGLNGFYRAIILNQLQKTVRKTQIADDLDNVGFKEKTVMFFSLPYFEFPNGINEADNYYKAIGKMKNFSEIRNKLLHGHSIMEISDGNGATERSRTFELLKEETLQNQIIDFKFIMSAVKFYFDNLKESNITESGKEAFKNQFLSTDFLNI